MHIALFGGSFNPPHLGHVLCALYAYKTAQVDEVWVLPSAEHPYGKDMLALDQRLEMCEAAFAGLSFIRVCDDERHNEGGKTYNLIQQLNERYVNNQWSLIGGTDTAQDLPNWYKGDELQELIDVIAVPRQGYDHDSDSALPAISSSLVRERIQAGESINDLVPQSVIELITARVYYK